MAGKVESIARLKKRYPNEWLLLANVTADELTRPIKGKLVAHSRNRDEIYDRLSKVRGGFAIEYAGEIPKDLVVIFCWLGLSFLRHCRLSVDFQRGLLELSAPTG